MSEIHAEFDVVVIGAGPAGALAACRLAKSGVKVLVLEKLVFPRFVIGESLLPQSMAYLQNADMLKAIESAAFQTKNGANFSDDSQFSSIDFSQKFTEGWASTYQVKREQFDNLLIKEAEAAGAVIWFESSVTGIEMQGQSASLQGLGPEGSFELRCRFVVDASGYGRVLPRLLDLDTPSDFPERTAIYTHVKDDLASKYFDRDKILITVHPVHSEIWFWLIPFSDGTSSIGVVAPPDSLAKIPGSLSDQLWSNISETSELKELMEGAEECRPVNSMTGYSSKVKSLYGDNYALLGNAGEFLDPIFSSGVTIALKSADLLIDPLLRELEGEEVNWEKDFAAPLQVGVNCFRVFVEAWYSGELQKIIFNPPEDANPVKRMIVSILAGYAWDEENPFVTKGRRYLSAVAAQCG